MINQNIVMFLFAIMRFCLELPSIGDINLRATWICSRNDMLANIGVLIAAGLVALLQMAWPDIVVGLIIAAVILHSSVKIINEARVNLKQ